MHKFVPDLNKVSKTNKNLYLVHFRLGEGWLVDFIMAKSPVAYNVHNHI
jgi:hypothetical protein